MYWQCRTNIYSGWSRTTRYMNLRYPPSGSRGVALSLNHGRRHARARDRTLIGGKFATSERRDASNGGEQLDRTTARGRAQPTRALDKSERRRAARTFIARQPERRHVGRRARWLRKTAFDSWTVIRSRQIPSDNRCKHTSRVTSPGIR